MPSEEVAVLTPDLADAMIALLNANKPKAPVPTHFDFTNCLLAFTSGGATARSGTTLGHGMATLWQINDDETIADIEIEQVRFLNLATSTVGTNKYILLMRVSGKLVCVWEECA